MGLKLMFLVAYLLFLLVCVFFFRGVKDLTMKCNEEEKSLSTEAFAKVSLTNLRRLAVPDLSTDLGMNIFKKVNSTITHFGLSTNQC